ncbi:hypothetical protein WN990_37080 [Kitasatospora purpeofusca]|uniref:hypothetical protein n=1 Tax=Kitasatospora purpeofusca TaxID=67352 RepID=UPI0030F2FFE5
MALVLDEGHQRRQVMAEPVGATPSAGPRPLRARRQAPGLPRSEHGQRVLPLLVEVGEAGPLRPHPPTELLALELGLHRQRSPADPAVGLQPPLMVCMGVAAIVISLLRTMVHS